MHRQVKRKHRKPITLQKESKSHRSDMEDSITKNKYSSHHIHARAQTDGSFEATVALLGKWLNNASTEVRNIVFSNCIENFEKCPPINNVEKL